MNKSALVRPLALALAVALAPACAPISAPAKTPHPPAKKTHVDSVAMPSPPWDRNRDKLLADVNQRLREGGQCPFTMNQLIATIAEQAVPVLDDNPVPEPVERLLREMLRNRRFTRDVSVFSYDSDDIPLEGSKYSKRRLRLPNHTVVEVMVFSLPWGAVDKEGKLLCNRSSRIPIAYLAK